MNDTRPQAINDAAGTPAGRLVLVAEDGGSMVRSFLPPEHQLLATVSVAATSDEILALQPDLVLLCECREPSATAILRALRKDPRANAIPIIALCEDSERCVRSLNDGANDYVLHPIALEDFRAKIRVQLNLARAYRRALEGERSLREEAQTLNELALTLASELDLQTLLQKVTDAGTRLTGARYGAFFHNTMDEEGGGYMLYTLSGAPRAAFEKFGIPRATEIFHPTFKEGRTLRIDDVTSDPRYGRNFPHRGMPPGHLPVRSYLSVSVVARDGRLLGALLFGHPEPGVFTERAERLVQGVAAQAAVAVDNAHLYGEAMRIQNALRESEHRFRLMADHAPVIIFVSDPSHACTYINKTWTEITGQPQEEALGNGWQRRVHEDDRDPLMRVALATGMAPFRAEFRLRRQDGVYRLVYVVATPRVDSTGRLLGFVGSIVDVTEEREIANRLREADRRKNEFLAMLAHELRNPLAPISNGLELIRLAQGRPEIVTEARDIMQRQVRHMVRLIDDLLDVSRITRGKIELRLERAPLRQVIDNAVEATQPLFNKLGHTLVLDLPESPIEVEVDVTRLAQVFTNLLNNAAQYTPPGGRINLTARREGNCAVVRIRDNGIGIPPDMLATIFDMFVQVDQSIDKLHGGLGIGLTLVHRLLQLHQGSVQGFSAGPGKGSEFVVSLPVLGRGAEACAAAAMAEATPEATPESNDA